MKQTDLSEQVKVIMLENEKLKARNAELEKAIKEKPTMTWANFSSKGRDRVTSLGFDVYKGNKIWSNVTGLVSKSLGINLTSISGKDAEHAYEMATKILDVFEYYYNEEENLSNNTDLPDREYYHFEDFMIEHDKSINWMEVKQFYLLYGLWCDENGIGCRSMRQEFVKKVEAYGYEIKPIKDPYSDRRVFRFVKQQ